MNFSDAELEHFVNNVMKPAWAYQKAKGKVDGEYPSATKPSIIYHTIFKRPPTDANQREMLKALDRKYDGYGPELKDYQVTISHKAWKKTYEIDRANNSGHARAIAIGKYTRDNPFGHRTQHLVNSLVRKGEILIEVGESH